MKQAPPIHPVTASPSAHTKQPDRRSITILICIYLFGLLIRIPWIGLGLPVQYQPDEWACVNVAFGFFNGNFINHGTLYPTLYMYMVFVGYALYFLFMRCTGGYEKFFDFFAQFYRFGDPWIDYGDPVFFTIARLVTAFAFMTAVFAVGWHIATNYPLWIAAVTSMVLTLLPWEFVYSRYAVTDGLLLAAALAALCAIDRFIRNPDLALWSIACFAVLLACSAKQPGMLLVLSLIVGGVVAAGQSRLEMRKIFAMAAIGTCILAPGYILINPGMVFSKDANLFSAITYISTHFNFLAMGNIFSEVKQGPQDPWWNYLYFCFQDYGPVLVVLSAMGMVLIVPQLPRTPRHLVWAAFIYSYFLIMQLTGLKVDRYVLPLTSVAAAWLLPEALRYIESRVRRRIVALVVVAACVYPAYQVIDYFFLWSAKDTRMRAGEWLAQQNLDHTCIAREIHFTPHIPPEYRGEKIEEWSMGYYSIDELKRKGVGLLMISNDGQGLARNDPARNANYQSFKTELPRAAIFSGKRKFGYYNPEITVYHIADD